MQTRLALAAMAVVTLVWAGNFAAAKIATAELHWAIITSLRMFLGALFFAAIAPRGTLSEVPWRKVFPLALTGIALNLSFFTAGMHLTTPGHSAIIQALIPVFVVLFSWPTVHERPSAGALFGMAFAVAGAVYLAVSASASERSATLVGDCVTFGGTLAFSLYVVLSRRALARTEAFRTVTQAYVASVPLALPLFLYGLVHQDWAGVSAKGWTSLAYMIVGATCICYSLHMWALQRLDALRVSIFTNIQPVFATIIAQFLGVEAVTGPLVVSGVLVIFGVAVVQIAGALRSRRLSEPEPPAPGRAA